MNQRDIPEGLEVVANNLNVPWSMEFSPDGKLFFTERPGYLKTIAEGKINTILTIDVETRQNDEGGLLGLALSPNYLEDHYIYLYYTYKQSGDTWNRVCRYVETRNGLQDSTIILDKIPGGRVHNGGRIKFGPDGKLYITTGETWKKELAADKNSLAGKILRVNPDGTIPADNPWPSLVYSIGNRNSQGLAWHPISGKLYSSEHGPSGENGWRAHDEINIIEAGANYGWPMVIGSPHLPQYRDPVIHTGDRTWAPSGICFYSGARFPLLNNKLLVSTLRGKHLRVLGLGEPDFTKVDQTFSLYLNRIGRIRDVIMGPDEHIYLCTSNRDGRGDIHNGDDFIYRINQLSKN